MRYGIVIYEVRDRLGISNAEYLLLDCVCKMQSAPNSGGWCKSPASYLANVAGVTHRRVFPMMTRLKDAGLLEVGPDNRKRVSQAFFDIAVAGDLAAFEEFLAKRNDATSYDATSPPMTPRHTPYDATSYPTYDATSYRNTNNSTAVLLTAAVSEKKSKNGEVADTVSAERDAGPYPPSSGAPPVPAVAVPFAESEVFRAGFEAFEIALQGMSGVPPTVDAAHYWARLENWGTAKGGKMPASRNWMATAQKFVTQDLARGAARTVRYEPINNEKNGAHAHIGNSVPGRRGTQWVDPEIARQRGQRLAERYKREMGG